MKTYQLPDPKAEISDDGELFAVEFILPGEPASMKNNRELVEFKKRGQLPRPAIIKSAKARQYVAVAKSLMPRKHIFPTNQYLRVIITIFYASRHPDLDEAIILDVMQGAIYKNDRQIKEKHVYWGIDKEFPHSVIRVEKL